MAESDASNKTRERAISIFNYLVELMQLRTKVVRDLARYDSVFWFSDVPHEQGCYTIAWGDAEDTSDDVWLAVRKQPQPCRPNLPDECSDWIDPASLDDCRGTPQLRETLLVKQEPASSVNDVAEHFSTEPKVLRIEDYPNVERSFQTYVERKWKPWSDQYRRWESIQNAYAKLFSIHQDQQRLGEEYELIVALGYLTWQRPSSYAVRRHLLAAQATLEFDADRGIFEVHPGNDGAKLTLEIDMLDPSERPSGDVERSIKEAIQGVTEEPWDRSAVDSILRSLVQSLDDRGEYDQSLDKQDGAAEAPKVRFAPALILRKRSSRTILSALGKILDDLKKDGEIPTGIIRICQIVDTEERNEAGESDDRLHDLDGRIYFPLPANDEQRQIVHLLRSRQGVLVQGPPGTGKSHTIANLICHLLANGQRVLVTAQTPRALKVLKDKLPKDIAPLCVSVLGNDRRSLDNLERCIFDITNRHSRWNPRRHEEEGSELETLLESLLRQRAALEKKLRSVREAETHKHEIVGGAYCGTAMRIAAGLASEAPKYDWFEDPIEADTKLPFSPSTFREMRKAYCDINANRLAELSQQRPQLSTLPSSEELLEMVRRERLALKKIAEYPTAREDSYFPVLAKAAPQFVLKLIRALGELRVARESIERRPLPWIKDATYGILTDQDMPWRTLRDVTANALDGLSARALDADHLHVDIPEGIDHIRLRADVQDLKEHLDNKGHLGWWIMRPKVVKRAMYVLKTVRVNGRSCDSEATLSSLLDVLEVRDCVDRLWGTWAGKTERIAGGLAIQVAEIAEHLEALDIVIALDDKLQVAKTSCHAIEGLGEPHWHDSDVLDRFLNICEAVAYEHVRNSVRQKFNVYRNALTSLAASPDAHAVCRVLLDAIVDRDLKKAQEALKEITELDRDAGIVERRNEWHKRLNGAAPNLASRLAQHPDDEDWDERIGHIADAWNWSRAKSWLADYQKLSEAGLERQVGDLTHQISETIAQLAANKAWSYCFTRMSERQRQYLKAWQLAIKKIGKGTGKYAAKHRRNAQKNLENCRDAIPAWIMPLYRVYDTIVPEAKMFDVVIVDEASQCGPDSLPLLYVGRKIVIVGDDQQISPEAVGVDRSSVDQLIRRHLDDIEFPESFEVDSSLFAHGEIRYGNRVVLREHFRCMPEIIRFSNDLCYASNPLIPLRQYLPKRLAPVVTHQVPDGYADGSGSRIVNKPEAEALVNAIVLCCRDPHYEDKTMGVISLQGDAQARLIESMLLDAIDSEEIESRRIICGNAYSFQGDERDVMFLSLVAAPNRRIGSLTKFADKRRFNVAASRARDQMLLFHTATLNDLGSECLRRTLLQHCLNPRGPRLSAKGINLSELRVTVRSADRSKQRPPRPFESWFELDVFLHVTGRGYRVLPQFRIAHYRIDLVVEGMDSRLAVECDGDEWHGIQQYQQDVDRQRTLERCGWTFWRVRGSDFCRNPESALESLWDELEKLAIRPASDEFQEKSVVEGYVPDLTQLRQSADPRGNGMSILDPRPPVPNPQP